MDFDPPPGPGLRQHRGKAKNRQRCRLNKIANSVSKNFEALSIKETS